MLGDLHVAEGKVDSAIALGEKVAAKIKKHAKQPGISKQIAKQYKKADAKAQQTVEILKQQKKAIGTMKAQVRAAPADKLKSFDMAVSTAVHSADHFHKEVQKVQNLQRKVDAEVVGMKADLAKAKAQKAAAKAAKAESLAKNATEDALKADAAAKVAMAKKAAADKALAKLAGKKSIEGSAGCAKS
jgi:hypothetical protein